MATGIVGEASDLAVSPFSDPPGEGNLDLATQVGGWRSRLAASVVEDSDELHLDAKLVSDGRMARFVDVRRHAGVPWRRDRHVVTCGRHPVHASEVVRPMGLVS